MSLAMPQARRRLHLRLALVMGVPYGVLMAIWFAVATDAGVAGAMIVGLLGGVLFGLVMSLVGGFFQWRAAVAAHERRRATDPGAPFDVGVRASETVLVTAGRDEVLRAAGGAAAALGRAKVRAVDEAEGTITLTVPTSWQSWGERVIVIAGPGAVTITSRPLLPVTVVDYGRNAANVAALTAWAKGL